MVRINAYYKHLISNASNLYDEHFYYWGAQTNEINFSCINLCKNKNAIIYSWIENCYGEKTEYIITCYIFNFSVSKINIFVLEDE